MKTADAFQVAEQRGYSRGYQAGRRRKKTDVSAEQRVQRREAFRQRAFLAALPFAMAAQGWKRGEDPIRSVSDRVRLAKDVADEAARQML